MGGGEGRSGTLTCCDIILDDYHDENDIRAVEVGRTTILDGWGIHMSLRGGWVWNIWGRDCVVVRHQRSVTRVGTDNAQGLADFLKARMGR